MAILKSPVLEKGRMHPFVHLSILFWLYTTLQCRNSILSNCLAFHIPGGISSSLAAFLFLNFLTIDSSLSCVNCLSLMSNYLLIMFVISSCVTFEGFPSKFSKCYFHRCIRSSWLVTFSLALFVILVGFLLIHLEAVFTSIRFFLTANVSHRTLGLALCFLLVCILLPLLSGHWRNSHIRHSELVFLISSEVHRICFLVLTNIYL